MAPHRIAARPGGAAADAHAAACAANAGIESLVPQGAVCCGGAVGKPMGQTRTNQQKCLEMLGGSGNNQAKRLDMV